MILPGSDFNDTEPLLNSGDEATGIERPECLDHLRHHSRRLSDKVMIAFICACELGDIEIAGQLLRVADMLARRQPQGAVSLQQRRRDLEKVVVSYEWLWQLRHAKGSRGGPSAS